MLLRGKVEKVQLLVPQKYNDCSFDLLCDCTNFRQWGIYAGILGAAGYGLSPIYRGLTIQFKV